jgi:hypothetical protein
MTAMHTESLSASSSPGSPLAALLRSKWACLALLAGFLATLSAASRADEFHTVLGAGVGAAAGAAIGQSVGGHNAALVGAGAGGLIGASIARGHAAPAYPMYPAYPVHQPRVYAPAPVVVWQPPVQHWQPPHHHRHQHHGHHYSHRDDRREQRYGPPARDYGRGYQRHWD